MTLERCDVAYSWKLSEGLPDLVGWEIRGRRLVISPRGLRIEHWSAHDSPGALHVFVDGLRVRVDGTLGGAKGLGFSDEPDRWGELVQATAELPDWTRHYLEAARSWEASRGNPRTPQLRLL